MATGIVLGGGGTLGDFQVGALKFLYEKDILPDIKCVCGTSIGAINAAIVSTGKDCDKRLESYWSDNVLDRVDLIPQHPWSEAVTPGLKAFIQAEKSLKLPTEPEINPIGLLRALITFFQEAKGISLQDAISAIHDFEATSGTAIRESALYAADKLRERLEEKKDVIKKALDEHKILFCLYATNVETGQKTCFTNYTKLVGTPGDTLYVPCHSSSLLIEAALASAAVPIIFPPVAVKFPHDEVCGKYYMDGGAREIVPVKGAIACEADEIYAILCIPRFTRERKYVLDLKDSKGKIVSTDWYTSNLLDVQPEDWIVNNRDWNPTSDECDVINIANRATAIILDEMTKEDLVATDLEGNIAKDASGEPIVPKVIDPLIPVHGWTKLNIGLLKINADQGYMRAFDVVCTKKTPIEEQCEELTAEITVRRIKIWALEHQLIKEVSKVRSKPQSALKPLLHGSHMSCVVPHCCGNVVNIKKSILDIREMKKDLKESIDRRLDIVEHSSLSADDKKRSLPDDYVCMYMCWEPHNWSVEGKKDTPPKPLRSTPWHEFDLSEFGLGLIKEDWSLGQPSGKCKSRSLLHFGMKSHKVKVS
ncbi:MAG: patatin-like phospholipase family protein [Halobacteriota archaeon]